MRYISVCSGIEAASVAWEPLGWKPVAFAEIDPFPCAVLDHRFPNVPNVGDISTVDWRQYNGAVDIVVGGTPCQSFSIAGRHEGMRGESGLVREYFRLLRIVRPKWFVWENVPNCQSSGSTHGEDFRSIIREWSNLGYFIAGRILDARYFGVPQQRRRLFVVGCYRDWRSAAKVFFDGSTESLHVRKSFTKRSEDVSRTSNGIICRKVAHTLLASTNDKWDISRQDYVVYPDGRVRRLMPVEVERIQGFPDGYTDITWYGKPAPDGARYKAVGNSMAVPVMRWIGERIQAVENDA